MKTSNQYRAIIIDDEPKLREVIAIKLNQYCPEIIIQDKAGNAEDGFNSIVFNKPQIVFLDIAMPGESGFEMLKRFDKINFEIIFVTGYNEYGLDAVKVSAVDYLLKPINTDDLIKAVQKAKEKINEKDIVSKYDALLHNINHAGDQLSRLVIPGTGGYEFVKVEDIVRCEGWQKYTKICLINGTTIISSYNIGVYKDMLSKYNFYETHKSHVINIYHIVRYSNEGILVMKDNSQIPVSRRNKQDFLQFMLKH